ncbi:MAG: hypothetical protein PHT88_05370 [Candidatus Moranbacteria bacterium]|nr:hypothetical protein [Candidatus Moranbacteria bacterium]
MKNPESVFEHERRFFPDMRSLPFNFWEYPRVFIHQGYLSSPFKTRIRKEFDGEGFVYTKTTKIGKGVSRIENEIEITERMFMDMWPGVEYCLKKDRYFIPWQESGQDFVIQLNIFHGALSGYVQVEIEFATGKEALLFSPPTWLGEEVTLDKRHGNRSLARHGAPSSASDEEAKSSEAIVL